MSERAPDRQVASFSFKIFHSGTYGRFDSSEVTCFVGNYSSKMTSYDNAVGSSDIQLSLMVVLTIVKEVCNKEVAKFMSLFCVLYRFQNFLLNVNFDQRVLSFIRHSIFK